MEVSLNQALMDEVIFEDEHGMDIRQPIIYEWKPIKFMQDVWARGLTMQEEEDRNSCPG